MRELTLAKLLADYVQILPISVITADKTPAHAAARSFALNRQQAFSPPSPVPTFGMVADPFVANFSRPGGNVTGFVTSEGSLGSKWVELLKEVAPASIWSQCPG